jgi:hypothetical protein
MQQLRRSNRVCSFAQIKHVCMATDGRCSMPSSKQERRGWTFIIILPDARCHQHYEIILKFSSKDSWCVKLGGSSMRLCRVAAVLSPCSERGQNASPVFRCCHPLMWSV